MDKRHLHHLWRQLKAVSFWYFLLAAIFCGVAFVITYRNNNLTTIQLRNQLLADDKSNTHVNESLNKLRTYVYGHMNASLKGGEGAIYPPIQLQGSYERAVEAAKQKAANANTQVTADAQNVCNQQFPGGRSGYLLCVQNYQAAHNIKPQQIPDSLYKFDFVAPRWSPDLAGWLLVAAIVFLILFFVRLIAELWLRFVLGQHA